MRRREANKLTDRWSESPIGLAAGGAGGPGYPALSFLARSPASEWCRVQGCAPYCHELWVLTMALPSEESVRVAWGTDLRAALELLGQLADDHNAWHEHSLNLVASHNYLSPKAKAILRSGLVENISAGSIGTRPHSGGALLDSIEGLLVELAKRLYGVQYVEYRPPSGALANGLFLLGAVEPGARMMVLPRRYGGHLSYWHGSYPTILGLARFPRSALADGDVFLVNDPYTGGPSRLADVTFVGPVFCAGELVGFVGNTGHWPDLGGKAPGQCALGDATEIYQEGLRIPPVRLYRAGELQRDILEMVLLNVRDARDREGDIRAHVGSVRRGVQRMRELVANYGMTGVRRVLDELLQVAEAKVRNGILRLPEGIYEAVDHLDDDLDSVEPIPMRVRVVIRHRPKPTITLDFGGKGGPARWGVNCPLSATAAMSYWVLRCILDPDVQGNGEFWRTIQLHVPEGCILNPVSPAPVGARSEASFQIPDLLFAALVPALARNLEAGGNGVHGIGFSGLQSEGFIYYETVAGGGGARVRQDGIDGVHDASNLPIEAMEMEFPIMAERLEYIPDSGGAGRSRRGLGIRKDYRILEDAHLATHSNRHRVPGPGLMGGGDGSVTRIVRNPQTTEMQVLPREASLIRAKAGDVITIMSGGSGYGDPLERSPDLVLRDVLDGKVTVAAAQREYGVVVNVAERTLDREATADLRERRRATAI